MGVRGAGRRHGGRYGNLGEIGWYQGNSGGQTHEVGQKLANAFGLYDMQGNVWQWVADWYGPYQFGAQVDPAGAGTGQSKVTRGGSWNGLPGGVRVSYRGGALPGNRNLVIGFRCVGEWLKPAVLKPAAPASAPVIPPPATAAGATKVNPKDGLAYGWIPPGSFQMGCSPGDAQCDDGDDERPAHNVVLAKGFWLGRTLVTQQAYRRVTGQNPSNFKGDNLPVDTVTWSEAKAYCAAVGGRLPTEAEWEYAARADSTGARYGNLDEIAWHSGNSANKSHEVGQKPANAFGLYDMLGNLWQWVADWYGPYQSGSQVDPSGSGSGQFRVLRGGSWFDAPGLVRVSYRFMFDPSLRSADIGFRCVGE